MVASHEMPLSVILLLIILPQMLNFWELSTILSIIYYILFVKMCNKPVDLSVVQK